MNANVDQQITKLFILGAKSKKSNKIQSLRENHGSTQSYIDDNNRATVVKNHTRSPQPEETPPQTTGDFVYITSFTYYLKSFKQYQAF